MLIQSLIVNIGYYGIAFILYINGVFIPTLLSISLLFGIGLVMDFIPTVILYFLMLKKLNIKIKDMFGVNNRDEKYKTALNKR